MNFSNTSSNTNKMQQHKKYNVAQTTVRREDVDLKAGDFIDLRQSACLNGKDCSIAEIMEPVPPAPLLSDADEQILLKITLKGTATITRVQFWEPESPVGDASNPCTVKVFVNKDNLDFSDIEDMIPVKSSELEFEDGTASVAVSGPSVSRVHSLQVLVESNAEDTEQTVLGRFAVIGHANAAYC